MTIFEKIINREIPSYIIYEDSEHIAILDINPIVRGHTLVIPKQVVEDILDMDGESYAKLMSVSQQIAKTIKAKLGPRRVGYVVMGFGVPHTHVHLVPLDGEADLNFNNAKQATSEDLDKVKNILNNK